MPAPVKQLSVNRLSVNELSVNEQAGFTLLEVIIAIALIAIALPAFLFSMAQVSNNTADASRDSIAYWIAYNQMETVKLEYRLNERLVKGESTGEAEMAGQRWDWRVVTRESELPDMWQVTVEAGLADTDSPVQILGFIRAKEEDTQPK